MNGSLQYDYITTELDPQFLSSPFEIQTNWHVLTGAACSGKTTLIDLLAEKGFRIVPEIARELVEVELTRGRTFDDMFGNPAFELQITEKQRKIEQITPTTAVTFLDRSLGDCLTFFRFCGLDPNEILADCFRHHYASVFILDRLPFQQDGARIENDLISDLLDEWLVRDYSTLGYEVVRVPVLPPKERLAFILDHLLEKGLISRSVVPG